MIHSDNDCYSETFVSKMDAFYLPKGEAANRVDANERKQALRELKRRKRFAMHDGSNRAQLTLP
jgi:hypothetical protein